MNKFIDEVWTENPGTMLRVVDLGGMIELSFIEANLEGKPFKLIYSAEITKYRWERIAQGDQHSKDQQTIKDFREALEKIDKQNMPDLPNNLKERSMVLAGLWMSLKILAKEVLSKHPEE